MKISILRSLFGKKTAQAEQPGEYDLRRHPNAVMMKKEELERIKGVLIDLVRMTQALTKKDIQSWRMAWQRALSVENPSRFELLNHYRDAVIDNHLEGTMQQRKLEILQKTFRIVDRKSREEKPELTALLEKPWFQEWMSLAWDSILYGYSLVQFGDVVKINGEISFSDVTLVPREHVVPEYSRIVKYPNDYWKNGVDFTQPPLSNWCMGIGRKDNLGLLLKVVPQTISIRHMEAFWDQFGEIFGMPIRIAKTTSRDNKERSKIESMLENMGAAAWGLFPDGTDIEIKETTRGDAFRVYDQRIVRAESRISKAIIGQTMTIEDGSSRSQSETHLKQFEKIVAADAMMIKTIVNYMLLPLCNMHGFGFGDTDFEWVETTEYTPEEQMKIEEMLLKFFDIEPKYFEDKYGVPVVPKKNKPAPIPATGEPLDFFE
jgi:hypothetical protein